MSAVCPFCRESSVKRALEKSSLLPYKEKRKNRERTMNVPNHIAIILDGNGRWAKAKGMPRGYGHIKGCANLETDLLR